MQLPTHIDITDVLKIIDAELSQVRKLISKETSDGSSSVRRWIKKFDTHTGKMIRPALVLLSGKCCSRITQRHVYVAAIVEMIHNATLLHDDVIDEGKKRRGSPTVNFLAGNESAVLFGDYLLSRVFRMCACLESKVRETISETTAKVCEGELRQAIEKNNMQLSEQDYIRIIADKSASFFSGCCSLGGYLSQANKSEIRSLSEYGLNLGIAFQITDDLMDIIANEKKTGKTVGRDVHKNKPTLAVIHLLKALKAKEKVSIIKKLNAPRPDKKLFTDILRTHGSIEYAQKRAQLYTAKAINALTAIRQSRAKQALINFSHYVARRVN